MTRQEQSTSPPKKSRADAPGVKISVRLQPKELAELDDWRRAQPDCPTRPEALRRRAAADSEIRLRHTIFQLRSALTKIAAEQSFSTAQSAADTFQTIAREALGK